MPNFELQERRKELTIFDLGPEVANGRFEKMLPHFSLDKKAANQLQASKAKVIAGFIGTSLLLLLARSRIADLICP